MELYPLHINNFKVDGGVMFGVVPKKIWHKRYPADEDNLVTLALRSLLVKNGDRLILVDTGWGDKQEESFFRHARIHDGDGLQGGIRRWGYETEDITDVVLTHLHADHCGGTIQLTEDQKDYEPVFPNATVYVGKDQWNWAINPNIRERDAFLRENILPIQKTGRLRLVTGEQELFPGFEVRMVNGHTPGQLIPVIHLEDRRIIFAADLIPTASHIPILFNMAYDLFQLDTIREKDKMLNEAYENGDILLFEHDVYHECASLKKTEKGIRADETFTLEAFMAGREPF